MLRAYSTSLTSKWSRCQCASAQPVQAHAEEPGIVPQVAVEKSKGSLSSAIELLRKYVDTYMLDRAAWEELGELYLQVWDKHSIRCSNFVLPCTDQVFDNVFATDFDAQSPSLSLC